MNKRNTFLTTLVIVALLAPSQAPAGDWEDALRGGLLGAALGVVVGNHSHNIKTGEAVAALAATGALFGYAYDNDGYRISPDDYGYNRHYRRAHYPYAYPRRYYVEPQITHYYSPRPSSTTTRPAPKWQPASPASPHPGVQLHFIPVRLPQGISISLRIVETGGKFIGPHGKVYDSLPTAEMLVSQLTSEDETKP